MISSKDVTASQDSHFKIMPLVLHSHPVDTLAIFGCMHQLIFTASLIHKLPVYRQVADSLFQLMHMSCDVMLPN